MVPGDVIQAVLQRPAWHRRAACRGLGPALFFPSRGGNGVAAQDLCRTCPVSEECLSFALADESLQGTWGGTSEPKRQMMRRATG